MASFFETQEKDLGRIRRHSVHTVVFKALDDIPEIKNILVGCGCTKPKYNAETKELTVIYKAGEIPRHIIVGNQNITKYVTINYKDGSSEVLTITAVKMR